MVCKPDRLARSTAELLAIEADLSKRGVGLIVLSMGGERFDTRNPTSKLMLTILAGVATWEREIMLERQRQSQGRGQIQGPPGPSRPGGVRDALAAGEAPAKLARRLKVARSSIYRLAEAG
jgi:DNA invertase Pin-like site-specific DNA recombinase